MIGYLGPEKSFTYFAASNASNGEDLKAYENIQALFVALKNDEVDKIIVPIENSTEGTINITIDLIYEYNLSIISEHVSYIELALIANHNDLSKISNIMSHTHALAQVRETLTKHLGAYKEIGASSTSKAVETLSELDDTHAVVASKQTLKPGQHILLDQIQDYDKNSTRFVMVQKKLEIDDTDNKTSIICIPHRDAPGLLYDILHEFAIRRIDLSKIESRPNKKEPGTYNFYIDFLGNINDEFPKEALDILKHKITLKILGSYKSIK